MYYVLTRFSSAGIVYFSYCLYILNELNYLHIYTCKTFGNINRKMLFKSKCECEKDLFGTSATVCNLSKNLGPCTLLYQLPCHTSWNIFIRLITKNCQRRTCRYTNERIYISDKVTLRTLQESQEIVCHLVCNRFLILLYKQNKTDETGFQRPIKWWLLIFIPTTYFFLYWQWLASTLIYLPVTSVLCLFICKFYIL